MLTVLELYLFVWLYMILCIYVCICVLPAHNKGEYPFNKIFVFVKGMKGCNFFFLECQRLLFKPDKPLTDMI